MNRWPLTSQGSQYCKRTITVNIVFWQHQLPRQSRSRRDVKGQIISLSGRPMAGFFKSSFPPGEPTNRSRPINTPTNDFRPQYFDFCLLRCSWLLANGGHLSSNLGFNFYPLLPPLAVTRLHRVCLCNHDSSCHSCLNSTSPINIIY